MPDRRKASVFVAGLADGGATAEELILDLLAPAEREVGLRWQRRRWNVAQEHAATAIVESELAMLAFDEVVEPTIGRMVVACVEGEWHSLPARMASELLRLGGWDVTFLGPSVPADDLAAHVRQLAPDAVGLSCSVPLFLKGAHRSIVACRAAGVPVVTGGTGFGDDGRYAVRLGADGWTADPRRAPAILGERPGDGSRPPPDEEHLRLEAVRPDLVARALDGLDGVRAGAEPRTVTEAQEALDALVTSVECACLVDDSQVVAACVPFIERLLPSAVIERTAVPDLLHRLVPAFRRHSVRAVRLTEEALRALSGHPDR
ncbi:MAG: cobalamin-dependent protein [Actinomycetota bacterium]|nr:cobalamin-dependent protein [Actinomycetota bacterium]